ncbi:MAG: hypothetical protein WD271_08930 [Acidimicrobiia bacterium]
MLVVLVCVLAPISVLGVWVRNTVLHTDQYVDTMAPLATDPAIQEAVATRVTNALIEETGLEQKISDLLPTKAEKLAPVIAGGAEQVVHTATLKIVESDKFETLWNEMNKRAHTQVVAVLQGEGTESITTKNGQVVVHLGPVVGKVTAALSKAGIGLFDDVDATRLNKQIVLLDSQDLRKAQGAVDLLNDVANYLPFVLLVFLAIAIWLSGNRPRTILRTALGIAFAMALMLILFNLGRSIYLDSLPSRVNQDAASAVYDQVLSFLRTALRTSFVLAIVVAIGAWLSGPGHAATRIRARVRGTSRDLEPGEAASPVATFVDQYRNPLRTLVVGIGLVILVVLTNPGPVAVLLIAVLVLIGLLVIELLGRNARPASVPT